jgi:tetratricopeptide (TPR) repeat protein
MGANETDSAFYAPLDDFFGETFGDDMIDRALEMPRTQLMTLRNTLENAMLPGISKTAGAFLLEPVVNPWPVDMDLLGLGIAGSTSALAIHLGVAPAAMGLSSLGAYDMSTGVLIRPAGRLRVSVVAPDAVEYQMRIVRRLALYAKSVRMPVSEVLPAFPDSNDERQIRQWELNSHIRLAMLASLRPLADVGAVVLGSWSDPGVVPTTAGPSSAKDFANYAKPPFVHISAELSGADEFIEQLTFLSLTTMQVQWKLAAQVAVGGTTFFEGRLQKRLFRRALTGDLRSSEHLHDLYRAVVPNPESLTTKLVADLRRSDEHFFALRRNLSSAVREMEGYLRDREWTAEGPALIRDYIASDLIQLNRSVSRSSALRDLAEAGSIGLTVGAMGGVATMAAGGRFVEGAAHGVADGLLYSITDYIRGLIRGRGDRALLDVYAAISAAEETSPSGQQSWTTKSSIDDRYKAQDQFERMLADVGLDPSILALSPAEHAVSSALLKIARALISSERYADAKGVLGGAIVVFEDSERLEAWLLLATVVATMDGTKAAIAEYERLLKTKLTAEDRARVHLELGVMAACQGDATEAQRALRIAQRSGSDHVSATAAIELGVLRESDGKIKDAMRLYEEATGSSCSEPRARAHLLLGVVYRGTGQMELAKAHLSAAIDANVEPWSAHATEIVAEGWD